LVNKLLVSFIPLQERQAFRSKLNQLHKCDRVQEWAVQMQPHNGQPFDAALSVAPVCDFEDKLVALRWIVRDITQSKRDQLILSIGVAEGESGTDTKKLHSNV